MVLGEARQGAEDVVEAAARRGHEEVLDPRVVGRENAHLGRERDVPHHELLLDELVHELLPFLERRLGVGRHVCALVLEVDGRVRLEHRRVHLHLRKVGVERRPDRVAHVVVLVVVVDEPLDVEALADLDSVLPPVDDGLRVALERAVRDEGAHRHEHVDEIHDRRVDAMRELVRRRRVLDRVGGLEVNVDLEEGLVLHGRLLPFGEHLLELGLLLLR